MNAAGLSEYFENVFLSDKVGVNKPHPLIFEHALKVSGVLPNEVIMIGDNFSSDISGAQSCGIDQIWYNPHE